MNKSLIRIFPNPTTGHLTLTGVSTDARVRVFNLQGQQVLEKQGNAIDLSTQAKGVYLVQVVMEGTVWNGKLVKE